jgi:hypothetical protein
MCWTGTRKVGQGRGGNAGQSSASKEKNLAGEMSTTRNVELRQAKGEGVGTWNRDFFLLAHCNGALLGMKNYGVYCRCKNGLWKRDAEITFIAGCICWCYTWSQYMTTTNMYASSCPSYAQWRDLVCVMLMMMMRAK